MSLRRRYKRKYVILGLLFGPAFAVLAINHLTDGAVSHVVRSFFTPIVLRIPQGAAVLESLQEKEALRKERAALRARLAALEPLAYQTAALQRENETLKTLLSVVGTSTAPLVMAHRALTPDNPFGVLVLVVPPGVSVPRGALVIDRFGFAVGYVSGVRGQLVTATLFSGPGVKTELLIPQDKEDEPLLAYGIGQGSGNLRIELPSGVTVASGTLIYGTQTRGYPVAIVGKVQARPESPLVHVFARSPESLRAQDTFFIAAYAE